MRIRTIGAAACLLFSSVGLHQVQAEDAPPAQPAGGEPVAVEVFTGPKVISVTPPVYPRSEAHDAKEGWVQVNFMIDTHGKPYEVTVVDSTGNRQFEKASIRAVEDWKFEPAMQGDTPISVGHTYKLRFILTTPGVKASSGFVSQYRKVSKAIDGGDKAAADQLMPTLEVQNLYEDAFANLARYYYYRHWGTDTEQLAALRRAIAQEPEPRYLDRKNYLAALQTLLGLEVKVKDYGAALETWEVLQKNASAKILKPLEAPMQQVAALRDQHSPYGVPGKLDDRGSWGYHLFRNRFHLEVSGGHVSEIKLRCEKQYLLFRFEDGVQYTLDGKHGTCGMQVLGDPDTEFQLIQS